MILLIDSYDSFSYNLYQLVGALNPDIQVIRNGTRRRWKRSGPWPPATSSSLRAQAGRRGRGSLMDVVQALGGEIPILGVCLGHQAICAALGGTVHLRPPADARQAVPGDLGPDLPPLRRLSQPGPGGPVPLPWRWTRPACRPVSR